MSLVAAFRSTSTYMYECTCIIFIRDMIGVCARAGVNRVCVPCGWNNTLAGILDVYVLTSIMLIVVAVAGCYYVSLSICIYTYEMFKCDIPLLWLVIFMEWNFSFDRIYRECNDWKKNQHWTIIHFFSFDSFRAVCFWVAFLSMKSNKVVAAAAAAVNFILKTDMVWPMKRNRLHTYQMACGNCVSIKKFYWTESVWCVFFFFFFSSSKHFDSHNMCL